MLQLIFRNKQTTVLELFSIQERVISSATRKEIA